MLIVDKPAGLVVHPSAGHASGTLVNALLGRAEAMWRAAGLPSPGVGRPGIVHRLDKDTSGLLLVAKTDAAQASLMRQFGERSIEKEYVALVRGEAPAPRGRIEAPVGRDPRDRQRMAVVAGGREAVTEYEALGSGGGLHAALAAAADRPHPPAARAPGLPGPADRRRPALRAAVPARAACSASSCTPTRLTLDRPLDGRRLTAWSELPPDLAASLAEAGIDSAALPHGVGAGAGRTRWLTRR